MSNVQKDKGSRVPGAKDSSERKTEGYKGSRGFRGQLKSKKDRGQGFKGVEQKQKKTVGCLMIRFQSKMNWVLTTDPHRGQRTNGDEKRLQ